MQALPVDLRDKAVDAATGVMEFCESLAVDLLGCERSHEAFGVGVVEGFAQPAHADGDFAIGELLAVGNGGGLHAAVGVMDQAAGFRLPGFEAFSKAAMASEASSVSSKAQPTALRENASSMTAR